ncbi:MAG TPA: GNAT family N-acetyltransferase [Caulobacteraceae bacterium]|jgi:RimJ/RimL family protein N-acetyltransferase
MLRLVPATDAHFAWMLGERGAPDGLALPPGGVDTPPILRWLRRTLPTLGGHGCWLMAADGEVVGVCSYKWPPTPQGDVEIGYGVAPERRRLGYAAQASKLIVEAARLDPRVRALTAETALGNAASQRLLAANGFFQVGRGRDDEEGETIRWRLELANPAAVTPAPALLAQRLDALYVTADGCMVRTNEWDGRPAPRFHLMLTAGGPLMRLRSDVPAGIASRLAELAAGETWDAGAAGPPAQVARYVEALARHAPVQAVWSGPAFAALRPVQPLGPALDVGADNAGLLRGRFDDWLDDVPHRRPFVAVAHDAGAVSICASVRIAPTVHCAGVESHPEHRRRGHALVAVSAWAHAVQALGATPFYSTSWENAASRQVAARLRFQPVATDLHIA